MEKDQQRKQGQKTIDTKAKIEKYFGRLDEATDERIIQWLCDVYGLSEEEVRNTHVYILKTDIIFKFIADCKLTNRDYHFNAFTIGNRANEIAKRITAHADIDKKPKNDQLPF